MNNLQITDYTLTTAAGLGKQANFSALKKKKTGLAPCSFFGLADFVTYTGEINSIDDIDLPAYLSPFHCRNNQLAELGLQQDGFLQSIDHLKRKYGKSRIGIFMGTSTSGIHETEKAYFEGVSKGHLPNWYQYQSTHNTYSLADYLCKRLDLTGISEVISTACSSSAKVFASASRAIALGLCDAALVGGVDSLCLTTLFGFNSLQLVSPDICKPCDQNRQGLSIGEAAGFALVEKPFEKGALGMLGYGESSDAYHMSSPHPEGLGAQQAMNAALQRANLAANDIDYINLHGTGTPTNDAAETCAVAATFGQTPASSTKGWTGHTLGAAGIVETALSLLCIESNYLPNSLNLETLDPSIRANILQTPIEKPVHRILTNSFGFGGSNCSLILGSLA